MPGCEHAPTHNTQPNPPPNETKQNETKRNENKQVKQVSDLLSAATGCAVAVPDVFHSKPWSMDRLPPKAPQSELLGWIAGEVAFSNVSKDLDKVCLCFACWCFACFVFCASVSLPPVSSLPRHRARAAPSRHAHTEPNSATTSTQRKTVEALRARGCGKFGIVGFCWGASIALQAGAASGGAFSAVAG